MAYSYLQASSLARNPLAAGVFKAVCTTNELITRIAWLETEGTSYDFSREGALASAEFVALNAGSVTESSSAGDKAAAPLRMISSDLDIFNSALNLTNPNGDPRAWQIEQKIKATGLQIQAKAITGSNVTGFAASGTTAVVTSMDACVPGPGIDTSLQGPCTIRYTDSGTKWALRASGDLEYGDDVAIAADGSATLYSKSKSKYVTVTIDVSDAAGANGEIIVLFTSSTNEPDGMQKLCAPSQVIPSATADANGSALSFATLDSLLVDKVKIKTDRCFLMNAKLKVKYLALARSAQTNDRMAIQTIGPDGNLAMQDVPAYGGIPILQVDDIPSAESKGSSSTLSSVYLASLTPRIGFHGVVQAEGSMQDVNLDPYSARIGGFKLYDLGQRQTKPAYGYRVEWYGAFGLGSPLALARASELVTA